MLYTMIDGVDVKTAEFPELSKALQHNLFFKFMDSGRKGIELGLLDAIHCFEHNMLAMAKKRKQKYKELSREVEDYILQIAIKYAFDQFIREGTKGFEYAMLQLHQHIHVGLQGQLDDLARKARGE